MTWNNMLFSYLTLRTVQVAYVYELLKANHFSNNLNSDRHA